MPVTEVKGLPLYDYKCSACDHQFTLLRPVAERDNARCPRCDGEEVRRVISTFAAGIRRARRGGCGPGGGASGGG